MMPKVAKRSSKKGPLRTAKVLPFILANAKRKTTEGGTMGKRATAAETVPINKASIRLDDLQTYRALTKAQQRFYDLYDNGTNAIMLHGVAGTGKTFIALYKALEDVLDRKTPFKQLFVVRSCVSGRDIGFLPGSVEEKASVYTRPYVDMCDTMFGRGKQAWDRLVDQKSIEFMTTSFNRGITLDGAIIVVDEAQNLNWQEISTIMSRIGDRAKIIFCGDFRQTDLARKSDASGLNRFIAISQRMPSFRSVEFFPEDIVRGELCKEWIMASMAYEDEQYEALKKLPTV